MWNYNYRTWFISPVHYLKARLTTWKIEIPFLRLNCLNTLLFENPFALTICRPVWLSSQLKRCEHIMVAGKNENTLKWARCTSCRAPATHQASRVSHISNTCAPGDSETPALASGFQADREGGISPQTRSSTSNDISLKGGIEKIALNAKCLLHVWLLKRRLDCFNGQHCSMGISFPARFKTPGGGERDGTGVSSVDVMSLLCDI